jgi:c-di-GMP-binding flagellar brake protein YcgR
VVQIKLAQLLNPDSRLEVVFNWNSKPHTCHALRVSGDLVVISVPEPVDTGTEACVFFTGSGGYYSFKACTVRSASLPSGSYRVVLRRTGGPDRIQRRRYYRLKILLDAVVQAGGSIFPVRIKDISGGGVLTASKTPLPEGRELKLCIDLRSFGSIWAHARITRAGETEEQTYRYEYGLVFTGIDEKDREKIIKFIFSEQRRLLEKGV